MICFIVICLLAWLLIPRRPSRSTAPKQCAQRQPVPPPVKSAAQLEREQRARQRERIQAEKKARDRDQAAIDEEFYISQLDRLYSLLWEADAALDRAREIVDRDTAANQYGAVISVKETQKHIAARERAEKRVMMLENSIHAAEKKLSKAQYIKAS